jgi:recombination protein RecT
MIVIKPKQKIMENEIKQAAQPQAPQTIQSLMNSGAVMKKLNDVLGSEKKASAFVSSVISVAQNNKLLRTAKPMTILSSAMVAATLDLPIVPTLGMAYIVPYKNDATFQIGYRGLLELAMRSGEFKNIIDEVVYEGQLISKNKFTGEYVFDEDAKKSDKPIGIMARFDLINGFSKTIFWTMEEVEKHSKRFSQAYSRGFESPWKSDFEAMAKKTVLKSLLNKYAPKSVAMQTALRMDQAKVNLNSTDIDELNVDAFDAEYVDNEQYAEVVDEEVNPSDSLFPDADNKDNKKEEKK